MSERIRIGVAGLNWGAKHARAFAQNESTELTALADTDANRLEALAKELGTNHRYASCEELMLSGSVDAVVVATPSYLHERQVGTAFDNGLHVLCETPVGIRGSEVSHVVTSAGLVGKTFMGSNPIRFDPRIQEAIRLIEDSRIGEAFRASSRHLRAQWAYPADSWRLDRERGGGALLEVGLPILDATWFALGAPDPMEALAGAYDTFSAKHAKQFDRVAEDAMEAILRLKNGATLQHSAQIHFGTAVAREPEIEMRIWGSEGSLDLCAGTLNNSDGETNYAQAIAEDQQFLRQAEAFCAAIASPENESPYSGKQALGLMKMVDAMISSSKEKQSVSIKVERSLDDLFGGL